MAIAAAAVFAGGPAFGPVEGVASWYGAQFQGRRTANGEVYDKEKLSCAHRSLPFGTYLRVRNLDNGSSVVVRVNDRGPFAKDRILDLSEAAARLVGMVPTGTARVSLSILPPEEALAWEGGPLEGAVLAARKPAPAAPMAAQANNAPVGMAWRIQVASYSSEANAKATMERLAAAGLSASIELAGGHFRVAFPLLSEEEARIVSARLERLGYRGFTATVSRELPKR